MRVMPDDDLMMFGEVHPAITRRGTAEMASHIRAHFTVARFDEWVSSARTRPGARVLYGCGLHASTACAPGVARRMMAMAEAGLVQLFQPRRRRADGDTLHPFDYIAIRTTKPVPPGFPKLAPSHSAELERVAGINREQQRRARRAAGVVPA